MDQELKAILYALTAVFVVQVADIVYTKTYNNVVARISAGHAYYLAQRLPAQPTLESTPVHAVPVTVARVVMVPTAFSVEQPLVVVSEPIAVAIVARPVVAVAFVRAPVAASPTSIISLEEENATVAASNASSALYALLFVILAGRHVCAWLFPHRLATRHAHNGIIVANLPFASNLLPCAAALTASPIVSSDSAVEFEEPTCVPAVAEVVVEQSLVVYGPKPAPFWMVDGFALVKPVKTPHYAHRLTLHHIIMSQRAKNSAVVVVKVESAPRQIQYIAHRYIAPVVVAIATTTELESTPVVVVATNWAEYINSHKMERLEPISQLTQTPATVSDITESLSALTISSQATKRLAELVQLEIVAEKNKELTKSNLSIVAPHTLAEDSSLVVESSGAASSSSSADSDSDSSSLFDFSPVSTPATSPPTSPIKSDFISMDAFMSAQSKKQRTRALASLSLQPLLISTPRTAPPQISTPQQPILISLATLISSIPTQAPAFVKPTRCTPTKVTAALPQRSPRVVRAVFSQSLSSINRHLQR